MRVWLTAVVLALVPLSASLLGADPPEAMKPYTEKLQIGDKTITFEMVPIPGGKFKMGSPASEEDRQDDEGPQVEVVIEPFWMAKCEVTWEQYDEFMDAYNTHFSGGTETVPLSEDFDADAISFPTPLYEPGFTYELGHEPKEPAVTMTQFAARQFTKWLSLRTGSIYRLPTEAEWEYACRAGTTASRYYGDDIDDLEEHAWYYDNADDKYQEVGQKGPNPWGLMDMLGNVSEWVLDGYDSEHYSELATKGPVPAADAVKWPEDVYPNVVRGGSWDDDPEDVRAARRFASDMEWSQQDPQIPNSVWWHTDSRQVGMRVIRPLKQPTAKQLEQYWAPRQEIVRDVLDIGDRQIRVKMSDAKKIPGVTDDQE
jgi:formylglycine-generating enzyme required for sulfatase activity